MEVLRKTVEFLVNLLKCPNDENFDEDFQQILQILYFFGFYQPNPTKWRIAYGALMFVAIVVTFSIGALKDVFRLFAEGNLGIAFFSAVIFSLSLSFETQILSFMWNQVKVVGMLKRIHRLHEKEDKSLIAVYRTMCLRLLTVYKFFLLSAEFCLIICRAVGLNTFILIIPAVYDELAERSSIYFFMILHVIHYIGISMLFTACDLLHILCIVRVEANLEILNNRLRRCADSSDLEENERNVFKCVEYHCRVIAETNQIRNIFKNYFLVKVHGIFVELSFALFMLIQFDFSDEPQTTIAAILCIFLEFFQFGTPCYFGQRLATKSDDLLNASYECSWIGQTKSFKTTLKILRTAACQKALKISVLRFHFSHERFYQVIIGAFNYYNNLCSMVADFKK